MCCAFGNCCSLFLRIVTELPTMATRSKLVNGFTDHDAAWIDKMILEMEDRMQEKYDETVKNLEEKLSLAARMNERLLEEVKKMSVRLAELCEELKLEPPKSFEEFVGAVGGASSMPGSVSHPILDKVVDKIVLEDVRTETVISGTDEDSTMKFDSANCGDVVDGMGASSGVDKSLLRSLGKQTVVFKCLTKERQGKGLNDAPGRLFSGIYKFDSGSGEIPARITFIREKEEEDEPSGTPFYSYVLSVCLPEKFAEDSKAFFYGDMDISFCFFTSKNEVAFSQSLSIEAKNGTCKHSGLNAEDHIKHCDNDTAFEEDFFKAYVDLARQSLFDGNCMRLKSFPENNLQCFFFRAEVEFFAAPNPSQGDDITDSVPEATDLELIAQELSELSETGQIAIEDWRRNPRQNHLWFSDMETNIELIIFSQEKGYESLSQQCVKNIKAVPQSVFDSGIIDVTVIKDLATEYKIAELLDWVSEHE